MSDVLLPYYHRELDALRRLAAEFADAHPKIAGRLRLTRDAVDDPHVARLLEGVAFLGARVQHRLDDEFPELTDALLGMLYPHYLAPVPSVAIARFEPDPSLSGPGRLPAGIEIETEPVGREPCRFRTTSAVTLWPVAIDTVRLSGMPLAAPANPMARAAIGCLRIGLAACDPQGDLGAIGLDRIRLFLRGETGALLLELMSAHAVSVAIADGPGDPSAVLLPPSVIEPVGFAPEDALLPFDARSFSGFRLLTELFSAREKFLFVDISGIEARTLVTGGRRLDLFVYLDRAVPELERSIDLDSVALGCTPIVNLFRQRCEPIPLDHTTTELRIVPDARRPGAIEIWSVERVRETRPGGGFAPWAPFHRLAASHGSVEAEEAAPSGFYATSRRPSGSRQRGTELFLLPYVPDLDPGREAGTLLAVDALCCNRDLPSLLPFGGGRPALRLVEGAAQVVAVSCLTAPTATLRRPTRERDFWRLMSHLSLGHLSVVGGAAAAETLREVLRLYDARDTPESRAAIGGLVSVAAEPGTARVPGTQAAGFCRGIEVTLTFDETAWRTGGLFVLASVLDRFLALHATVNSFVRTRVALRGRPGAGIQWPARIGSRALL